MLSKRLFICATPFTCSGANVKVTKPLQMHFLQYPYSYRHAKISAINHTAVTSLLKNNAIHTYAAVYQVRKENSSQDSKGLDVKRDNPYDHLTFGQKGRR